MLCLARGRSRDFRHLVQIRRYALVCLARKIKISNTWIPSEFNSERSRRTHDSAYDATNSLVDHLGSRAGRTLAGAHIRPGRDPPHCEAEPPAASDGVAVDGDILHDGLRTLAEETEDSLRFELPNDTVWKDPTRWRISRRWLHEKPPSTDAARGSEVDKDSGAAKSSDEEMPTAGRARISQRRGRVG